MIRRLTALALCGAALAGAAHAQVPHGPPGKPDAETAARHAEMRKQHMEDLKVVLRLRPDQEAALAAFVASHEPQRVTRRMAEPKALTTPERLEAMAKHEAEMRAAHERRRQALAAFYAALSPEQQKVFDALHRLQGPGPMMMHGGPPGGPHGGPAMMIRRHGGPGPEPTP